MKKLLLAVLGAVAIASGAVAGSENYYGREKQVAPLPCPQWYADREFNIGIWGTYVFSGNSWMNDRYLGTDHAWGGGVDFKYFFMRYVGVGIEGWAVDARQARERIFVDFSDGIFDRSFRRENSAIGAVLGTLTLRYPIPCTRFAPYIFGGGGGIFGGGHRRIDEQFTEPGEGFDIVQTVGHTNSETRAMGQVGGGVEVRFTPHIGWVSDFSWNFVDGPNNNFGMARTGVNFAF